MSTTAGPGTGSSHTTMAAPGETGRSMSEPDMEGEAEGRTRPRWGRRMLVLVAIAAAGAGGWLLASDGGDAATTQAAPDTPTLADVVATDLIETTTLDGTLGFVVGDPVLSRLSGTLTAVTDPGATLGQGDTLFAVNTEPVVLLLGDQPAWRSLSTRSDDGLDVFQLESALVALGYDPDGTVTIDEEFTSYTGAMVERWQEANDATVDGTVDLGEVVFLPEPIRIADVALTLGSKVNDGQAVLATSTSTTTVTVALSGQDQGIVVEGDAVTVVLPNGTAAAATVTSVGTVATAAAGGGGATFEVLITLDDGTLAAGLDEAPVEVEVVTNERRNAVAVPVTALLALAEGGYAVEVQLEDGSTAFVAVEPGFYAEGLVEVVSGTIAPGQKVVVP